MVPRYWASTLWNWIVRPSCAELISAGKIATAGVGSAVSTVLSGDVDDLRESVSQPESSGRISQTIATRTIDAIRVRRDWERRRDLMERIRRRVWGLCRNARRRRLIVSVFIKKPPEVIDSREKAARDNVWQPSMTALRDKIPQGEKRYFSAGAKLRRNRSSESENVSSVSDRRFM